MRLDSAGSHLGYSSPNPLCWVHSRKPELRGHLRSRPSKMSKRQRRQGDGTRPLPGKCCLEWVPGEGEEDITRQETDLEVG